MAVRAPMFPSVLLKDFGGGVHSVRCRGAFGKFPGGRNSEESKPPTRTLLDVAGGKFVSITRHSEISWLNTPFSGHMFFPIVGPGASR